MSRPGSDASELIRVGLLAAVATSPLVPLALGLKDKIEAAFEGTTVAGYGFLVTAAMLVTTAWLSRREGTKGPAEMTWLDALLIGLAQMVAPLPGVSRSGMTIAAALALGLSRTWAVGFSLLIAVPAILGAAVFELRHVDPAMLTPDRFAQTIAATVAGGRGRLFRHPMAIQGCPRRSYLVFFCILGRAGDRGPDRILTRSIRSTGASRWRASDCSGPGRTGPRCAITRWPVPRPIRRACGWSPRGRARPGPSRAGDPVEPGRPGSAGLVLVRPVAERSATS